MTGPSPVADPARDVRRIAAVVLLVVAAAAALALALGLHHAAADKNAAPARSIFPATFRDAGFLDGSARLVSATARTSATTRVGLDLQVPVGTTIYVVGRCDTGTLRVVVGGASSDGACSGRPAGILALAVTRASTHVTATVSGRQRSPWGLAFYR